MKKSRQFENTPVNQSKYFQVLNRGAQYYLHGGTIIHLTGK
jgi:hypothetical protein